MNTTIARWSATMLAHAKSRVRGRIASGANSTSSNKVVQVVHASNAWWLTMNDVSGVSRASGLDSTWSSAEPSSQLGLASLAMPLNVYPAAISAHVVQNTADGM